MCWTRASKYLSKPRLLFIAVRKPSSTRAQEQRAIRKDWNAGRDATRACS
jgi:hypothetical protein